MVKVIHTWQEFENYLLIDKKLKSSRKNLMVLKSRFGKMLDWYQDKEWDRANFNAFITSLKEQNFKNSYINGFIKLAKHYDNYLGVKCIQDYTYFKEKYEEIDVLTMDEVKQLANVTYPYKRNGEFLNFRDKVVVSFLYGTACRIGELENLLWSDVRSDPIPHVIFRDTKSNEDRVVAITESMYTDLFKMPHVEERVFSGRKGSPFSRNEFGHRLKERATLCHIEKNIYPHIFRHSRATHLITILKFPLAQVSKFLGHKDPKTTMRYTHPLLAEMAAIAYSSPLEATEDSLLTIAKLSKEYARNMLAGRDYDVSIEKVEGDFHIVLHRLDNKKERVYA